MECSFVNYFVEIIKYSNNIKWSCWIRDHAVSGISEHLYTILKRIPTVNAAIIRKMYYWNYILILNTLRRKLWMVIIIIIMIWKSVNNRRNSKPWDGIPMLKCQSLVSIIFQGIKSLALGVNSFFFLVLQFNHLVHKNVRIFFFFLKKS